MTWDPSYISGLEAIWAAITVSTLIACWSVVTDAWDYRKTAAGMRYESRRLLAREYMVVAATLLAIQVFAGSMAVASMLTPPSPAREGTTASGYSLLGLFILIGLMGMEILLAFLGGYLKYSKWRVFRAATAELNEEEKRNAEAIALDMLRRHERQEHEELNGGAGKP